MDDAFSSKDIYNYADRAQAALLGMVRDVMAQVARDGLAGGHHFYLTYYTQASGVEMSDRLRTAHPKEITIVLQNQFDGLSIDDEGFEVTLSFNQRPERLVVPWRALSKFYDPSVAFGLMFDADMPDTPPSHLNENETDATPAASDMPAASDTPITINMDEPPQKDMAGEVVSLDSFRDK